MYFQRTPPFLRFLFPDVIWDSTGRPQLKLTFDDGPHPESTPLLLEHLDKKGLKATFFCLGIQAMKHPDLLEDMRNAGHTVANHGYAHLSGWSTGTQDYMKDYAEGARVVGAPALFRPAYGRITLSQYRLLSSQTDIVGWSHMPGDFDLSVSDDLLRRRIQESIAVDNAMLVLHDKPALVQRLIHAL